MNSLLAIVGRPNVGKSTLFNRLTSKKRAIVDPTPGVTRDRNYAEVRIGKKGLILVDTGGFESYIKERLTLQIQEQTRLAIEEADIILFLGDAQEGFTPLDKEIAKILRQTTKPILWVINKAEGKKWEENISDFFELGTEKLLFISALHNQGIDRLKKSIFYLLLSSPLIEEVISEAIKIAVVGRPNVGKSSLVNRILGYSRVIVDELPGTTRDAIDTPLEFKGKTYLLIDTGGIRRKARISLRLEKYCLMEALKSMERSDLALLVIDVKEGITHQDAQIGNLIQEKGRACILLLNKWDLLEKEGGERQNQYLKEIRGKLKFLNFAPFLPVSALTGEKVDRILPLVEKVYQEYKNRISTSKLNQWLIQVTQRYSPPLYQNRPIKLNYITQISIKPPTFQIFTNYPQVVPLSYRRYLINQMRKSFGLKGTPLKISFRSKRG